MEHSKTLRPLSFLSFVFPLLTAVSDSLWPFEVGGSDAPNSSHQYLTQFAEALNATFSILNTASSTAYFYNATSGSGPVDSYASFLCRYDIPLATCSECIHNATAVLSQGDSPLYCTNGKVSFGLCTFHYAKRFFFSRLVLRPRACWPRPLWRVPPRASSTRPQPTLVEITILPPGNGTSPDDRRNRTMYGMVQCAPDINATECRQCLNLTLYSGLIGCQISAGVYGYTGSCSVTYSLYAFYKTSSNSSVTPLPLTNRLLPPASSSLKLGSGEWVAEWAVQGASKQDYQNFANAQLQVYGNATFGWTYWNFKNVNNHWSLQWKDDH